MTSIVEQFDSLTLSPIPSIQDLLSSLSNKDLYISQAALQQTTEPDFFVDCLYMISLIYFGK